jgi:hypothetical protein
VRDEGQHRALDVVKLGDACSSGSLATAILLLRKDIARWLLLVALLRLA